MARNPESTKPTPSQLLLPGHTTQAGSQLDSQSWEISSPFLANIFSGNAKDEHQEWPEGAATAPEVTQVLSPGLPLSVLQFSCTQQITHRTSACIRCMQGSPRNYCASHHALMVFKAQRITIHSTGLESQKKATKVVKVMFSVLRAPQLLSKREAT